MEKQTTIYRKDFFNTRAKSGKCLNGFYRHPGNTKNFDKPDRMVIRFLENGLKRKVDPIDSSQTQILVFRNKYPELTPLIMDNRIWEFQRNQKD